MGFALSAFPAKESVTFMLWLTIFGIACQPCYRTPVISIHVYTHILLNKKFEDEYLDGTF